MNGIGTILQTILDILEGSGLHVPASVITTILVVAGAIALPLYLRNSRTGLARKRIAQGLYVGAEERERLEDEALRLVAGNPEGLIAVAETAIQKGRKALARKALERLRGTGKRRAAWPRLEAALDDRKSAATPEEEAMAIQRLLEAGLTELAAERQERANTRWPGHPALNPPS